MSRHREEYSSRHDGRDDRNRDRDQKHSRDRADRDDSWASDRNHSDRRHSDELEEHSKKRRLEKTSSGHRAGIHSAHEFGEAERNLKRSRDAELQEFNSKFGSQHGAQETVYRDKKGRKLDMLNEFMKQQEAVNKKEAQKKAIEDAQFEWGRGTVQRKEIEESQSNLLDMKNQPFARTVDDPKLEAMRKSALRDGDPMAAYFEAKKAKSVDLETEDGPAVGRTKSMKQKESYSSKAARKPLYRGPDPKPNRFGIRPGYRWDAVDRGNDFEHKVMKKVNAHKSFRDDEYKWSVSDL